MKPHREENKVLVHKHLLLVFRKHGRVHRQQSQAHKRTLCGLIVVRTLSIWRLLSEGGGLRSLGIVLFSLLDVLRTPYHLHY